MTSNKRYSNKQVERALARLEETKRKRGYLVPLEQRSYIMLISILQLDAIVNALCNSMPPISELWQVSGWKTEEKLSEFSQLDSDEYFCWKNAASVIDEVSAKVREPNLYYKKYIEGEK